MIGVDLRDFVAPKRMVGQTLQTDVMALSVEKQGTNVLQNQASNFFSNPLLSLQRWNYKVFIT